MIKILFLAANPSDTTQLRLDQEIRSIDEKLRQSEFRERFEIRQHWAVRVSDLQSCLLRHSPTIVHFSGHGSSESEIILEDDHGNSKPVSSHALSQLFSVLKDNIRCVVLNACYSEQQAQAIAKHIDCVIGMSKAIGDTAAISFAAAFYQALGYGRNVKSAFELGCGQIDLESLGTQQDIPKLLADKCDPQQIFLIDDQSTAEKNMDQVSQPWFHKTPVRISMMVGFFLIILTSIGVLITNHKTNNANSTRTSHGDSIITEIPHDDLSSNHKSLSTNSQDKLFIYPSVDSLNNRKDNVPHSNKAEQKYDTDSKKVFYNVKLLIPSFMSDAKIFVDEESAIVINRTPTVVTIRVKEKEGNHQIKLIKDNYPPCIIEQFIRENNLVLTPYK